MKVLVIHPYGKLNVLNHRLQRQIELMKERCDLMELDFHLHQSRGMHNIAAEEIIKAKKEFKPDVVYVNGFIAAHFCLKVFNKIVYDMGSHKVRNELLDSHKLTFKDMRNMSREDLIAKANWSHGATYYKKEKEIIQNVNAIIVWEGEEAWLARKIYGVDETLHEISMMFYDIPKPILWHKKQDKVMAIAAKWGKRGKNGGLLNNVKKELKGTKYSINSVGHGGGFEQFVEHDKLMDELNDTKVLFCPYICGGIGAMNEALLLGCNVVVGDWHPYRVYTNDEITIDSSGRVMDRSIQMIKKAMEKQYLPKKSLPSEKEQLDKIFKVFENVIKQ